MFHINAGPWRFGVGLVNDMETYKELLEGWGYEVEIADILEAPGNDATIVDVQVMVERLDDGWGELGLYNMLLINQDIQHDMEHYDQLDAIICKSRLAVRMVTKHLKRSPHLHYQVIFLGHTSVDPRTDLLYRPKAARKDFTQFLHLAGKARHHANICLHTSLIGVW